MGSILFFLLFSGAKSGFYLHMVVYFYFMAVHGFYYLFLLGSYSVLLGSYSVHILCTKLWWFCTVISIKPTTKKTRNETIQNKKNPYYKNILIEVLNKKDKEKKKKNMFLLYFSCCYLIFYLIAWKSWPLFKMHEKFDILWP